MNFNRTLERRRIPNHNAYILGGQSTSTMSDGNFAGESRNILNSFRVLNSLEILRSTILKVD